MGAEQECECGAPQTSVGGNQGLEACVCADEENVLSVPTLRLIIETYVLALQNCNVRAEAKVVPDDRFHMEEKEGSGDGQKVTLMDVPEERDKLENKDIDFRSCRKWVIMDKSQTPGAAEKWNKSMKGDAVVYNPDYEATEKQRVKIKVCDPDAYTQCLNDRRQAEDERPEVNLLVVKWGEGKAVTHFMVDGEEYEIKAE